jgi:hypothetical protein
MLLRNLITLVSLATIAVALGVWEAFPHYAGIASYVLLGWMFGSLVLIYGPWSNRQVGRPRARNPGDASTHPLPSGSRSSGPGVADLGFCVFCAAPLAPGAPVCPSCGHAAARF